MHAAELNRVARHLRESAGPTDRQLLAGFCARGDQAAFAELVGRHGPMVLRVCRRVLRHEQDAEDAFQATFLVLARKAGSVRRGEALASWLHGVAHRVALRARRDAGRRRAHEREAQPMSAGAGEADWGEVQTALDEEIRALPEKYRAPFVLCFLEGKSRAEAAGELGLKEGTVWSRLSQARERLRERLGRRGIALPALLAAVAISGGAARAAPAGLFDSTVRAVLCAGGVSARAAALARGVSGAMPTAKASAVLLCLVTTGLLAFGAVLLRAEVPAPPVEGQAEPKPAAAAPPAPATEKPPPAPDPDDPKSVGRFRGRVNGPDGKPLGGARVFVVGYYDAPGTLGPVRATTDADGRFEFDAPDLTFTSRLDGLPCRREGLLVATKDGYAPDWFHSWGHDHRGLHTHWDPVKGAEINLHLAKDDVPIRAQLLDPTGRPLAGARVRLSGLKVPVRRDLDAHLKLVAGATALYLSVDYERYTYRPHLIPGLTTETRTDADGRFTMSGLGRDRLAELSVSAPTVVDTTVTVMTRNAPDVEAFLVNGKPTQVIHGAGFTLQLRPGLTLKGRVIDRDSREPVAGMWVGPLRNAVNEFSSSLYPWATDEKGRFTITGLDPLILEWDQVHSRTIVAAATPGLPYQTAWVEAKKGNEDILIECRRGIPFRLKVVDEQGKPVEAEVTYMDVQADPGVVRDEVIWPVSHAARRADGTYEGFVLPGPGAVLVRTHWSAGYRPACVDPKAFFAPGRANWTEKEQASAYGTRDTLTTSQGRYLDTIYRGGTIDQTGYAAIVLVNPPEGSGPLQLTATVVRDRPRRVSLVDPDGKPVVAADRAYLGDTSPRRTLRAASFPLYGLHPDRLQHIAFYKDDRQLIGLLRARGDGDTPYTVRMQPWGTVTGRLLDENGKPLSEAFLSLTADGADSPVQAGGQTDKQGRFRAERVVPGLNYSVSIYRAWRPWVPSAGGPAGKLVLRPGEVRDLGDIRAKPPADAE
jgi:RNA polymerase sigma factor (sigma-70 family)